MPFAFCQFYAIVGRTMITSCVGDPLFADVRTAEPLATFVLL
jgi:hypothetical protein